MSDLKYPGESPEYRKARDELLEEEKALAENVKAGALIGEVTGGDAGESAAIGAAAVGIASRQSALHETVCRLVQACRRIRVYDLPSEQRQNGV